MGKKIVQYGAGNIGRSLVGQLFSSAGWEVVFVDVVPEVVAALNERRSYRIVVKDDPPDDQIVRGVRAVDGRDSEAVAEEIAECRLLSTAVGPKVLPRIAPIIAAGLAKREKPLDILLCENLRDVVPRMEEWLKSSLPGGFPFTERVGLIATSIGKMVPIMPAEVRRRDPLEVWAEAYNQIIADRQGFIGEIPQVPGLVVRDCFQAYVDQKLFVHNMGHATAAYLGDKKGCRTIAQAMEIDEITHVVRSAMEESGRALVSTYADELSPGSMKEHIDDLCRRFGNHALGDTVYRVGRDRPRKYAPNDRMIGSLRIDRRSGVDPEYTIQGVAAGFHFSATDDQGNRFPADIEFDRLRDELGIEGLLREHCRLDGNEPEDRELIERILRAVPR